MEVLIYRSILIMEVLIYRSVLIYGGPGWGESTIENVLMEVFIVLSVGGPGWGRSLLRR